MKLNRVFGIVLIFTLITISLWSKPKELEKSDIESIRLLSPNNIPVYVLGVLNRQNMDFIKDLINTIVKIHESDNLNHSREKFLLHLIGENPELISQMREKIGAEKFQRYVQVNDEFFTSDVWMQDWGEVGVIKLNNRKKPQLLVLDSNRGRGIGELPGILSHFWNCYYLKNPSDKNSCGDYGGNIEVTPDDNLILGSTSSEELRNFFSLHGYKDRMVIVDTKWLIVGHCDEYISICPNENSPTGYTIFYADPVLTLKLIQSASAEELKAIQNENYSSIIMELHEYLNSDLSPLKKTQSAEEITDIIVSDIQTNFSAINNNGLKLRYKKYMKSLFQSSTVRKSFDTSSLSSTSEKNSPFSEHIIRFVEDNLRLGTLIHRNLKKIINHIDVNRDIQDGFHSLVSFPMLYKKFQTRFISYFPGVVNQLILRKHLIIPDSHVPFLNNYIDRTVSALGLTPHFLNNMYYHKLQGEIHCGTNVFRHPNRYIVNPRDLPELYRQFQFNRKK